MDMDGMMKKLGDAFNTARDKVLDLTDKAGKKAGEVYDVAKLKIRLNDIRRDISSLYKEIGQAAYNARQADEEISAAIGEKCGEIERLYHEMEELAKEVEQETGEIVGDITEPAAEPDIEPAAPVETEIVDEKPAE